MFTGIGGFEYGIEQAYNNYKHEPKKSRQTKCESCGERSSEEQRDSVCSSNDPPLCVGYSEIDKYAIQIFRRHYPNIKNYGDATTIIPEELPDFDMLCGGFPCQSFSIAGKRMGFKDTRGTLFFDIARIAKVKRPKLLLLENVKGLLNHAEGRTFATILATLDELGYNAEWQCLNSKHFGVPQNRERVFIIGHLRGESGQQVFPFRKDDRLDKATREKKEQTVPCLESTMYKGVSSERFYGVKSIFNSIHSSNRIYDTKGISPTIRTPTGGNNMPKIAKRVPLKFINRNQKNIEGNYSFTVDSSNTGGVLVSGEIRRLTPIECERLQGFPDGWTEGISDTQRYKCLGNAVTTNVIDYIIKEMLKNENIMALRNGFCGKD